uniref:U1-poneritoxin-Dq1c n=1 Tax=Dinoponera quadriceps TaxID=609295 RepID=TX1C_DINQU|nr:RecName: Full=U1-poneritoxin-Dq1c; Short=U1-PONTX-Dq1c; AltName: Full=Peptide Dq-1030; AltName: Full=Poneratoxin [Dinoponera quadriceps]
LRPDDLSDT